MHILHITLGFFPAQTWGGPVKTVYRISKELMSRDYQVTVYCTNLFDKKHKIQQDTFEREFDGIRVVYFNTWSIPWWPGTLGPIWLPNLSSYLKREISYFDVVHIHGYRNPMMLPIVRAAYNANIPIVTQPHGTLPIIMNSIWGKKIYDWLFGRLETQNISALIVLQESERQQALKHGIPEEQIEIIPVGIDPQEKEQIPNSGEFRLRFGIPTDQPTILFLGRINKKKGVDMLLEAFVRINDLNAHLIIAGPDDGQLDEVKELTKKYELCDDVTFTGLLSGNDVYAAFQDSDLFVLPCRADTFPSTIIESCLIGIPMVITDRCEIAHLVNNRVAEVTPFDANSFACAMERLLTDQELYNKYKQNCPKVIRDTFSIQASVDKLEALYQRVIAESIQS